MLEFCFGDGTKESEKPMTLPTQDANFLKFMDALVQKPMDSAGVTAQYIDLNSYNLGYIIGILIVFAFFILCISRLYHNRWGK